jgi:hypothetical protein
MSLGIYGISDARRDYYLRRAVVDALTDHGPLSPGDLLVAVGAKYVPRGVVPQAWFCGPQALALLDRLREEGVIAPLAKAASDKTHGRRLALTRTSEATGRAKNRKAIRANAR